MQSQGADPYRVAVDIGIAAKPGELPRVERMEFGGRTVTKTFTAETEPASVTIDPETWLLMEAGAFTRRP